MRYKQYSYELEITRSCKVQTILMHEPLDPSRFMNLVNQSGTLKVHALVDTSTELNEHNFIVVGTGKSIPDEYIDRLISLGTLLFSDSKYGYSVYYLKDNFKSCDVFSEIHHHEEIDDTIDFDKHAYSGKLRLELVKGNDSSLNYQIDLFLDNIKSRDYVLDVLRDDNEVLICINNILWLDLDFRIRLVNELIRSSLFEHIKV